MYEGRQVPLYSNCGLLSRKKLAINRLQNYKLQVYAYSTASRKLFTEK
jgi:hypothetical protein